ITPVPLHVRRLRKRGFNQAYLLIRKWRKIAEYFDVCLTAQIERELLKRNRDTSAQVGMKKAERRKNVKNAFEVINPSKVKGKRILLVDDVFTTGSTSDECAKVLMKSGAVHVDVITLVRADRRI
ncbi:phosphoribosyltransferase family protein, partial [Desulfobacterales bacterium HSG16]|nr:phosphoribosyltransferase family protein [Desulfobacterales bacterium HSG16]